MQKSGWSGELVSLYLLPYTHQDHFTLANLAKALPTAIIFLMELMRILSETSPECYK